MDGWMKEMRLYGKGPEWMEWERIFFFFETQQNGTERNENSNEHICSPPRSLLLFFPSSSSLYPFPFGTGSIMRGEGYKVLQNERYMIAEREGGSGRRF